MKVSISWLNEWIEVADLDPEELAARLTMAGLEVDGVEYPGAGHDDIVVGQIEAIEDHPKADRLVVCQVTTGDGPARTIVCGAKNMKAGDRVPVALPGSEPPGLDFAIGERKVMGVMSGGMLCSGEELNLEEESEGLMILGGDAPLGEPIYEVLKRKDVVVEIDLTPNRPDCLSHLGVAREIGALYDRTLRAERGEVPAVEAGESSVGLEVIDAQGCPQYHMAVLEGVKVGPSPEWLRRRLESVGQRSINFVVDVTNYLLMDLGQPFHAFDLDKLEGGKIVVRRARAGEKLVGIDHNTYELTEEDLVIADGSRPVALAGVMGGAETEVTEETTRILLECAYFDPTTVRKSARRHGLHTESSHRFERGIDPEAVGTNLLRAADLLVAVQEEAMGSPSEIHGVGPRFGAAPAPVEIELKEGAAERLLGVALAGDEIREMLESIGLVCLADEADAQRYRVPGCRPDLVRPVDLIEEVARLYGYDRIPAVMPAATMGTPHGRRSEGPKGPAPKTIVTGEEADGRAWVRSFLLNAGLSEAINYSFMGAEDLDRLRLGDEDPRRAAPEVANPLVKAQAMMRTTLIPSLLDNLATNRAHRRQDIAIFEVGRRYFRDEERSTLGIALLGRRQSHWSGQPVWDFFDLKGLVESLSTRFAVDGARWEKPVAGEPYLHPGVQAQWLLDSQVLATVGQLHPAVAQAEGIDGAVLLAEVDLDELLALGSPTREFQEIGKYPAVVRDFAVLCEEDRSYGELEEAVAAAQEEEAFGAIFETLELFDVYAGEQVPEGYRSLAIKVTYRSGDRTLTEEEVERADRALLDRLEDRLGAKLR